MIFDTPKGVLRRIGLEGALEQMNHPNLNEFQKAIFTIFIHLP